MAKHQIGSALTAQAAQGVSAVTGHVTVTGRTALAESDAGTAGSSPLVLTELKISIDKTLAGPALGGEVIAYAYGGKYQDFETDADITLQSAWASDGSIFAQLTPHVAGIQKGAYAVSALPLIDGTVGLVDVGCETPTGYRSQKVSAQVDFLRNGKVVSGRVTFPAVRLVDIKASLTAPTGTVVPNSTTSRTTR